MDGYAATRDIRRREKELGLRRTPIIALTASALRDDIERILECGCDIHISKPVRKAHLLSVVQRVTQDGWLEAPDKIAATKPQDDSVPGPIMTTPKWPSICTFIRAPSTN